MSESSNDLSNVARGRFGEQLAAQEYQRRGCRVVDRNWRCPSGEIDLVVFDSGTYVFSEVKARRTDRYGPPASAVGHTKQRRLRVLALEWLREHGLRGVPLRFDVVSVLGARVEVIEGAF